MLTIKLPCSLIEASLDMALEEARQCQVAHIDNLGEENSYTAEEIARLEGLEARLIDSSDAHIMLSAEDIASIDLFAREWKDLRGIERITQDMIEVCLA